MARNLEFKLNYVLKDELVSTKPQDETSLAEMFDLVNKNPLREYWMRMAAMKGCATVDDFRKFGIPEGYTYNLFSGYPRIKFI